MAFKPFKILEGIGRVLLSVLGVLPGVLIKGIEIWGKNVVAGLPAVVIELAAGVVRELGENKEKSGPEKRAAFLAWIEQELRDRGAEYSENLARGLLEMLVAEMQDKQKE